METNCRSFVAKVKQLRLDSACSIQCSCHLFKFDEIICRNRVMVLIKDDEKCEAWTLLHDKVSKVNLVVKDVCVLDSTKFFLHLQLRSKGHPPSNRKESKVEKVVMKKKKEKLNGPTGMNSSHEHEAISNNDEPNYKFDLNVPV
uniref:SWIM-type domain-containing protein n=1 Tax=Lactuca sativa TaxID=4236 RepID=A0A9R1WR42_LACSA|nr:hypothetical protein LSAT_V11C100032790 [Lactuca sativa]